MKRFAGVAVAICLASILGVAQDPDRPNPAADPAPAGTSPTAEIALAGTALAPVAGLAPGPLLPLDPALANMTGQQLFAKILDHDRVRESNLRDYSSLRTYSVVNDKGRTAAQEVVHMEYHAPDRKTFITKSGSGSPLIRDLVLDRLVQSEKETASGRAHRDSGMKPENYTLRLIGEQEVGPYHCLVAEALPKRRDRYLFEGKVWVNSDDYGIVRMAGHPAKSLSFWLTRAEFVRQYQKIGDFWLPAEDQTLAQVRLYGKKILMVKYDDYQVNGAREVGQ